MLRLFFSLGVEGLLFDIGDSKSELSSRSSGPFDGSSAARGRFLFLGVLLGRLAAVLGDELLKTRGDRRRPSVFSGDEYSKDLSRFLKDAATAISLGPCARCGGAHYDPALASLNTYDPVTHPAAPQKRRSGPLQT